MNKNNTEDWKRFMEGRYKNRKNQKIYMCLAKGIDCTNVRDGIEVVIYHLIDDNRNIYVRELQEFINKFEKI